MTSPLAALQSIPVPRHRADGTWNGRLTLGSRDPDATFEATEELLGYFARLSATGAFAIDIEHVDHSQLDLEVVSTGSSFEARISACHLHPGSWRILLQLLAHCHSMEPYDSIALVDSFDTPTPPAQRLARPLALSQPYPPILNAALFVGIATEGGLNESLSLSTTCTRQLSKAELQKLSSLVEDWGSLMYVGGFTPATVEIEAPLIDKPDVVRQGWSAFDVLIRYWSPNEAAFATLVNLLIALRGELSINTIEIE